MAKLNLIIKALPPLQITILTDLLDKEQRLADKEGKVLPEDFLELRETFSLAAKYVGIKKTNV